MKKVFLKILIPIILFVLLIFNTSFAITGKVNDSNIRVRSGPSTEDTETLTNLYLNDPVEVIERTGDWYKIITQNDITGYIAAEFLNVKGDVPGSENKTDDEEVKKSEEIDEKKDKVEEAGEEEIEETTEVLTVKIKKNVIGRYMPLIFSAEKHTFKKDTEIEILDEKALWKKVRDNTSEAWVLSIDLE